MIYVSVILPQSTFGFGGYCDLENKLTTPNFFLESNPSFFTNLEDWGFSFAYGTEFSNSINANIYAISVSKTIGKHSVMGRYTPGYQKEFLFSTGEKIIFSDTTVQSLSAKFNYKELFGLGYSYKISDNFSAGFSLRYFTQQFERETVTPVIGDTTTLQIETLSENADFWKTDFGLVFNAGDYFTFRLESANLLNFGENVKNDEFADFELRRDKEAELGFHYHPSEFININLVYETSNSFQAGIDGSYKNFYAGLTAFHDNYQHPFVAGVIPSLAYKTDLFEVMLSGVKYFSDRNR